MYIFLDDERPAPHDWKLVQTPQEVIDLLKTGKVEAVSLDHDLGDDEGIGTGYDVLRWIEEEVALEGFVPPDMKVHSANPAARVRMEQAIKKIRQLYSICLLTDKGII